MYALTAKISIRLADFADYVDAFQLEMIDGDIVEVYYEIRGS